MIPYLGCESAREMLQTFVDGELPMTDQVALESHLRWCTTCGARVEDLRIIGAALRLGSGEPAADAVESGALVAIQAEVLARVRAERDQSFGVRFRALFEDMHFMWPALGASVALGVCLLAVLGINSAARAIDPNSMADRLAMLADPGSDRNPVPLDSWMLATRPLIDAPNLGAIPEDEAMFALAAVVTREGRVANYELLNSDVVGTSGRSGSDEIDELLEVVTRSRFSPAQTRVGGGPMAVNVVWVVARTTVKAPTLQLGALAPLMPTPDVVVRPLSAEPERKRPVLRPARS